MACFDLTYCGVSAPDRVRDSESNSSSGYQKERSLSGSGLAFDNLNH